MTEPGRYGGSGSIGKDRSDTGSPARTPRGSEGPGLFHTWRARVCFAGHVPLSRMLEVGSRYLVCD